MQYNLSSKLRKLKKVAQTHFLAGNTPRIVSQILGISESLLQEWHDEFVVDVIQSGAAKRVFLRELLLRNSPAMIMILARQAKQKGDEDMAHTAARAVLSFASRFMAEDMKIIQAEQKFRKDTDNDPMFKRGLFDFADPDVDGSRRAAGVSDSDAALVDSIPPDESPEVIRAIQMLEQKGLLAEDDEEPMTAPAAVSAPVPRRDPGAISLYEDLDDDAGGGRGEDAAPATIRPMFDEEGQDESLTADGDES